MADSETTTKKEAATKEEAPTEQGEEGGGAASAASEAKKEVADSEAQQGEEKTAAANRNRSASPTPLSRRMLLDAGRRSQRHDTARLHEKAAGFTMANQQALLAEAKALARRRVRAQSPCFPLSDKTIVRASQYR